MLPDFMRTIGSWSGGGQVAVPNSQRQSKCLYHKGH